MTIDQLQKIAELYPQKKYRPVQVFILYNPKTELLLVKSPKQPTIWAFPQGGMKAKETFPENLIRELKEELNLDFQDLSLIHYAFHEGKVDFGPARQGERGFSHGKYYFFTLARYAGKETLKPNLAEINALQWFSYTQIITLLSTLKTEKSNLVRQALDQIKSRLSF